MRSTIVSLTFIGLALAAIVAGYLSGQVGTRPPSVVQLHPHASPSVKAVFHDASDSTVYDAFSNDDVVVERPALGGSNWLPQRLTFVVGLVGESAAIDATFLRLNLPIAYDLDPHAAEALRVAKLIHDQGGVLLIHVTNPPSFDAAPFCATAALAAGCVELALDAVEASLPFAHPLTATTAANANNCIFIVPALAPRFAQSSLPRNRIAW